MELYVLDSLLRRVTVIDQFESMIWTERFFEIGDFEVELFYTPQLRALLPPGTLLAMSDSFRVMKVELLEQNVGSDGNETLKVSGRSIESMMELRSARNITTPLIDRPKQTYIGPSIVTIVDNMFYNVCQSNDAFPEDNIPFMSPGTLIPKGNIPAPVSQASDGLFRIDVGPNNLYQTISELCQAYRIGFRLVRDYDNSRLLFDVYTGFDRTTSQTSYNPVVFSKDLDNLTNTSRVNSISSYKNVAYVYHPHLFHMVRAAGIPANISGFARNVLTLDASDIEVDPFELNITSAQQTVVDQLMDKSGETFWKSDVFRNFLDGEWLSARHYDYMMSWINSTLAPITNEQKQRMNELVSKYNAAVASGTNALRSKLAQRGREELSKNRRVFAFDGEVSMASAYQYDVHYRLGDVIELQNDDGVREAMRVVEQIFVSDSEGERTYPTLEIEDSM